MKIVRKNYFSTSKCPGWTNILYVLGSKLISIASLRFIMSMCKHELHTRTNNKKRGATSTIFSQ